MTQPVAATSVGILRGEPLLDLCYEEDSSAEVDMNLVMTGSGRFVELQATAEKTPFDDGQLGRMVSLARRGIAELFEIQKAVLEALKLYCATTNRGKLREFQKALPGFVPSVRRFQASHPLRLPKRPAPRSKRTPSRRRCTIRKHCDGYLFVDDSGLEVDALGGAPGVYSARFAGPDATDAANNQLLLDRMRGVADRTARFVCVVALAKSGKLVAPFAARWKASCWKRRAEPMDSATILCFFTRLSAAPLGKRHWIERWK